MSKLVSVIIPVFNVEKYIRECFDHLIEQIHSDFEAILVDDGSTDRSGEICDEYKEKDKRFQVFHTNNRGIGAARNLAMEHMKGDYCFFLDPDDVLEDDSLSYLVNLIEKTQSDMALAVTRQFRGNYIVAENPTPIETVYNGHTDIIEKVLFDKNDMKPLPRKNEDSKVTYEFFSTLYRTKKLVKNDIQFLPISYGEDTYVCLKSLLTSNRVVTSSKIVYSHRRNPTSTTFQYHPFYLDETKEYYNFYLSLFDEYALEYREQAVIALDGQYLRRCVSALERELFMSPKNKPIEEVYETYSQIRSEAKFSKLFTWRNIQYLGHGKFKVLLYTVKARCYKPIVAVFRRKS